MTRTVLTFLLVSLPTSGLPQVVLDDTSWLDPFRPPAAPDDKVYEAIAYEGGFIITGLFEDVGSLDAEGIAYWDGASWHAYDRLPGNYPVIRALVVFDGDLHVGGEFGTSYPTNGPNIQRWTGGEWEIVGGTLQGGVNDLLIVDGQLLASSGTRVIRWTGTAWEILGEGDGVVQCLVEFNGSVIAGGAFTSMDGITASRVAKWDGVEWSEVSTGVDDQVNDMLVHGGVLYLGGRFATAGSVPASGAVAWDGASFLELNGGVGGEVVSLAEYGGQVVVGGTFRKSDGAAGNKVARWDGAQWLELGYGVVSTASGSVNALVSWDGQLVVAGQFPQVDMPTSPLQGITAVNLATWTIDGWGVVGAGVDGDGIHGLTQLSSDVYAVGEFNTAGQQLLRGVGRWDGRSWRPMSTGLEPPTARAVSTYDGEIVITGGFRFAGENDGTYDVKGIAAWDGADWRGFGFGLNGEGRALETYDDELVVAGDFTSVDGVETGHVAKWDGTAWSALGNGIGGYGGTYAGALVPYDGALVVGGRFDWAGDELATNIARWDGSAWSPVGRGLDGDVLALVEYDGRLIAGGDFEWAGLFLVGHAAAWDGVAWKPLGTWIDGNVRTLTVYEGQLVAGGDFRWADGGASRVAYWNGSEWEPFGSGLNGSGRALLAVGSNLYVGGSFQLAGAAPSTGMALWSGGVLAVPGSSGALAATAIRATPNPFNPRTTVSLTLNRGRDVTLEVFDAQGRLVRTINDGWLETGDHEFPWDGRDDHGRALASGTYFVRDRGAGGAAKVSLSR